MGVPVELQHLVDEVRSVGVERVHVLAWRDLDDPEAGGSEVHADHLMRRWAEAGLTVLHRTSAARGLAATGHRGGYEVVRRGSRYSVFPRAVVAEIARRTGPADAVVEIWNGVPWFSPVWCRRPHITILHHVHGAMWEQMLPRPVAAAGRALETRLAPRWYRRTPVITGSAATRAQLVSLGLRRELITVVDYGVDEFFRRTRSRDPFPTVVAVARLAPVKRMPLLIESALHARTQLPELRLRIVGDGPERAELERIVAVHGADDWITFTGRVSSEQLRDEYSRAWVIASASSAEGWGLTLTEAAACGTPAVASDIGGHRSSVIDGVTGALAPVERLGDRLIEILGSPERRDQLAVAARERARRLSWDANALATTRVFHGTVTRRHQGMAPNPA